MRKLLVFLWLATWLYLCLIPTFELGSASYLAWRELGCPNPAAPMAPCPVPRRQPAEGLLLWACTAPMLAWALWHTTRRWPARVNKIWWNKERPFASAGSLLLLLAALASVVLGALRAPYSAAIYTNGVAFGPILALGLWYRAVLLNVPPEGAPTHRPS